MAIWEGEEVREAFEVKAERRGEVKRFLEVEGESPELEGKTLKVEEEVFTFVAKILEKGESRKTLEVGEGVEVE